MLLIALLRGLWGTISNFEFVFEHVNVCCMALFGAFVLVVLYVWVVGVWVVCRMFVVVHVCEVLSCLCL